MDVGQGHSIQFDSIGKGPAPRDIMGWRQEREYARNGVVKEVPGSAQQLAQHVAGQAKQKSLRKITQRKHQDAARSRIVR